MAVAKWRTLSDAEKEEWRVKPRRTSGGVRGGSGQQRLRRMSSRFVLSNGGLDEDMLSISSVRNPIEENRCLGRLLDRSGMLF